MKRVEVVFFSLEGLELESGLCVFNFLRSMCFIIFNELCVFVDHGCFVLLLSGTLSLNLLVCPDGLGRGLLWGNNGLSHDGMEVGCFRVGGSLVGGLSLCGSHWDCFSSWNTVGATVGTFAPEGY